MARGLASVLEPSDLTVVVNVGDDDDLYGVRVSADVDTVLYTLAGVEGPDGWGLADDTFSLMDRLADLGVDTTFRLGDRDYAHCLFRTLHLDAGGTLSSAVARLRTDLGVPCTVLPATDDLVRTKIRIDDGVWLDFQDYFVAQAHRPEVADVRYDGAAQANPASGILDAIAAAEMVVIAPSNPPLSVWPILAIPGIRDAIAAKDRVVAVSPLIGGAAVKGPADRVMRSLGLAPGTAGVLAAYPGLISDLFVHDADAPDASLSADVAIHPTNIMIQEREQAIGLANEILDLAGAADG